MDLGGADGGRLAGAFGSGWAMAAASFTALGAFLWKILSKAKDDQIKLLIKRIEHLEAALSDEREQCRRSMDALNDRIRVLEALTLGGVRQAAQAAISEERIDRRRSAD